jgi:hypothetical protein
MEDNYFFDDRWGEFLYNILSNLNHEQKSRLNDKELFMLKNDSTIKRFSTSAPLKRQMVMLTRLGYDWFFGFYPQGKQIPDLLKKAYRQHTIKETRVDVMQEMIESHVFIIDNKAVATALAMMAMNSHSDVFVINTQFLKIPSLLDHYEKTNNPLAGLLRDHNPNNVTAEFRDAMRSLDVFNEIVGEVYRAEDYVSSVLRISKLDYWILHYLFKHRNNYVTLDYLKRQIGHKYPGKAIAIRCTYLFKDRGLIDKIPKTSPVSYTIKSDGILVLGEIMNMIINRATKS